jgi:hypothetical protein
MSEEEEERKPKKKGKRKKRENPIQTYDEIKVYDFFIYCV